LPLSFAQQRMWLVDHMFPGRSMYNIPVGYRLTGPLDVPTLQRSLNKVVERHEALRTTFSFADGQPVQMISPRLTLTVPAIDLRGFAAEEREPEAMRLAIEEAEAPFDLAAGPLLRARLLKLADEHHILLLTMHHIVSDGWSMAVLFRDLSELYAANREGRPHRLPELPIQYADYALWQREWLQGDVLDEQLAYWRQQLGDGVPALELPADRPRPPERTFRGRAQGMALSEECAAALNELSLQKGATLFMTLLAAFKVLLYRYTGQRDVVVGTPIANRNRSEIEQLIGFFVNMLVLRTDLSGNPSFVELLARVREVCLGAYQHQDLPYEKLVEELHPSRDLSRNPLSQVGFVLQNTPQLALDLQGLTVAPYQQNSMTVRSDVECFLWSEGARLVGALVYNVDLFDAGTITRMVGHYETLLQAIAANPQQRIAKLPLLSPAEQQMLVEWNRTRVDYPQDECIHELFEAQVEQTPDAIAVEFEEQKLTYRELNARANQLARYLRQRGVGPEVLVGICLERSVEMIVGILGILKAGGAYVPLDPDYPKERLAWMLEDAQPPVLLTREALLSALPASGAEAICLDSAWELIARQSQRNPDRAATADNLAYAIFTSGSTGRPNGVLIAHRGLCSAMRALAQTFGYLPGSRVLQNLSFSYDAASSRLFATLSAGATLCLPAPDALRSSSDFVRMLRDQEITHAGSPPSLWAVLEPEELPALETVIVGGEPCPVEVVRRWGVGRRLINAYGPTEATIVATAGLCADPNRKPHIGRPIANTQIYIVDDSLQPVPIGVSGELYIGGIGVARGYLKRPGLTADKFLPDPFSELPGARMYRTGDLARYLPDGNIDFLGRIDHQVKVRGWRIELDEIETVLAQHSAVAQAVVVAREDVGRVSTGPLDKRLVAYVVPNAGQTIEAPEVRSYLERQLPRFMVPSVMLILDALPRTPSGKIDRRALPAPDYQETRLGSDFVPPSSKVECAIAEIWREVLGLQQVGVHDNFFELGGHSLLAMYVVAQLEKELGVRVHPVELVNQSLGQMAASCEAQVRPQQQPESQSVIGRLRSAFRGREVEGGQSET
jgi:amino acid adenylation domain-containing protein